MTARRIRALMCTCLVMLQWIPIAFGDERETTVDDRSPSADAVGVPPDARITVTFTKAIDPATVTPDTFYLTGPDGVITSIVAYDSHARTATLTPAEQLRRLAPYTAHLASGVRDEKGYLVTPLSWSFETGPDPALAHAAFPLNEGTGATTADSSANGNVAQLEAGARWTTDGKYGGALLLSGVRDGAQVPASESLNVSTGLTIEAWVFPTLLRGNQLVLARQATSNSVAYAMSLVGDRGGVSVSLRTSEGTPVIAVTSPVVAANAWTHLAATYDGSQLRLFGNGVEVGSTPASGTVLSSANPLWLGRGPSGEALVGVIDEVRVYGRAVTPAELATDMATPGDEITPPAVMSTIPVANAVAFDPRSRMLVRFSKPLDPATVTPANVVVRDVANGIAPVTMAYDASTQSIVIAPNTMLAERVAYTATLTTGITSSAGIALQNPFSWSFTTADVSPPKVLFVAPSSGATDIDTSSDVTATFSEDVAGVTAATFGLRDPSGAIVPASIAYSSSAHVALLHPAMALSKGTMYTATIAGGVDAITDIAGNPLASNYAWSFTTRQDAPRITSLAPASGTPGTTVVISGSGFGSVQGGAVVHFNGLAATASSWSDTIIVVSAPPFVTSGDVTVTLGAQVSNGAPFIYTGSGPSVTI